MAYEELKSQLKQLYLPSDKAFSEVVVPNFPFAVVDGSGDPEQGEFQQRVKWLFAAIQPIKREAKSRMGKDFVEPPLETLYWADNVDDFKHGRRDNLNWRLMVALPAWTDLTSFAEAVEETETKLGQNAPQGLRLEWFEEGHVVQIMHVGAHQNQQETLDDLYQNYLPAQGLEPSGYYHEIYLNDHKRTAPDKRKTVLRQPVKALGS